MNRWKLFLLVTTLAISTIGLSLSALAASTPEDLVEICNNNLYGDVFGVPNSEPLGPCQWNMALINASNDGSYSIATGKGVTVGVIHTGVDFTHPDIAPNLDVDRSCSFIFDGTPTADPGEIANGDCSNKDAVQDLNGYGTHIASTIAAPVNGIGIAGVAPEATIVALKACTVAGYCFADSVAAALRYATPAIKDLTSSTLACSSTPISTVASLRQSSAPYSPSWRPPSAMPGNGACSLLPLPATIRPISSTPASTTSVQTGLQSRRRSGT